MQRVAMRLALALVALVIMTLAAASGVVIAAHSSAADPPAVCNIDPITGNQVCHVQADPPPTGGSTSPGGAGSTGGGTGCVGVDGKDYPCYSPEFGSWSGHCWFKLTTPQPAYDAGLWMGHANGDGAIYMYVCPPLTAGGAGGEGMQWLQNAPGAPTVTPAQLAQRALKSLTIPKPTTGMSPDGRLKDGRTYTVVKAFTWFWSDSATYKTLTARAAVGAVWAQVTVTPTALTFKPGDGGNTASCPGPGRPWVAGKDSQWASAPGGCDYAYPRSTYGYPNGELTATYGITWTVTWTGSGGANGTLPDITTTTNPTFAVAEAQAVIVR